MIDPFSEETRALRPMQVGIPVDDVAFSTQCSAGTKRFRDFSLSRPRESTRLVQEFIDDLYGFRAVTAVSIVLCIPEAFPLHGGAVSLGRTRGCSFIGPDIIPGGTLPSRTHRCVSHIRVRASICTLIQAEGLVRTEIRERVSLSRTYKTSPIVYRVKC